METHWLLLLIFGLILIWAASLLLVRHWTRARLLRALVEQEADNGLAAISQVTESRPEDQAAREIIRQYRRRYLLKLWPDTAFSFKVVNDLALEMIQEIARVYYPEEERPELKASLKDLVALYNRVGARLQALLDTRALRPFRDVEVQTVLRYHEVYRTVKDHWGYQFIKRHHLDKAARWGWAAINYANPWYWGRKAAFEGSKEVAARLALARIADIVGEEAMLLYSHRASGEK
ncbi:MAG: hypothetical protein HY790_06750 [Deltaproteobacteria bacterium]|nr:hypothetical protein [Deltaproteobacteria bacterium]MBI4795524.1 hypothetical protein [Deltaproteobacteria bacterium]